MTDARRGATEAKTKARSRSVDAGLLACPLERAMRLLGGSWKGSILWHLQDRPKRFGDIATALGGASKKMVAQRLDELVHDGLVLRRAVPDRPVAVTYELTAFGRTTLRTLECLKTWSERHGI